LIGMRRNAVTISLTLSLFSTLCTCWVNGSIVLAVFQFLGGGEFWLFMQSGLLFFCCGPVIRARFSPCGGSGFLYKYGYMTYRHKIN
jgi:hypothetical protein